MSSGLRSASAKVGAPFRKAEPGQAEAPQARRRNRYILGGALAAILVVVGTFWVRSDFVDRGGPALGVDSDAPPAHPWMSGASGEGVGTGEFAEWRGTEVDLAVTWADNNGAMTTMAQLQPGAEYGSWRGALDISIGAIGPGESWADAADGAYDERWRESLRTLRSLRATRPGQTYIRFAHEMNGNWYDWAVDQSNYEDFIVAWRRFRGLQQEIYPDSKLVFGVNRETIGADMDWRRMFPGAQYVDVMGVDYYNTVSQPVETEADWETTVGEVDEYGAPVGILRHLQFAEQVGLPLAVPEWGANAEVGDFPVYVKEMRDFFHEHAGSGAGEVLYEAVFNMRWDNSQWHLYATEGRSETRLPKSAETYRRLF